MPASVRVYSGMAIKHMVISSMSYTHLIHGCEIFKVIIFLYLIALLSYFFGISIFVGANSSIHQIAGLATIVNGTVALAGAVIAQRIIALQNSMDEAESQDKE